MRWFGQYRRRRPSVADIPEAFRRALEASLGGDLTAVEAALGEVVGADSSDVDAYLGLVRVYRERGELGRAISLGQTLVLRPDLTPSKRTRARAELAASFRAGGYTGRAVEVFEEVLAEDRRHRGALQALSELMAEHGDYSRALSYLRRRSRVDGISARGEEALLWLELAQQAETQGKSDASRRAVRRALRRDSDCGPAHLYLGQLELARGRARSAAGAFLRAIELDPSLAEEAYAGLEALRPRLRRRGAYEVLLRGRLRDAPSDAGARVALARYSLAEGRPADALRELRELLDQDPRQAPALVVFLRATLALSRDSVDEIETKAFAEILEELDKRLSSGALPAQEPS